MFGQHPKPHHHVPHHHRHNDRPNNGGRNQWSPPLPTDTDEKIMLTMFKDEDLARSVYRILSTCPPEVAAAACIGLRAFNESHTLRLELEQMKRFVCAEGNKKEEDDIED